MTARERLLGLVAAAVDTAAQEGHPTGVKHLAATLDEVRELLGAVEAEARRPLEGALRDISTMLPGSVPLPMTEEQYLRAMLHDAVRTARAALARREPAS